jgi:hypothetical protein
MTATRLQSRRARAIRIHCPIEESSLRAFLVGDGGAIERDPAAGRVLAIIRASNPLGDFGLYEGVVEIGAGFESFVPTAAARPAMGASGSATLSPTAILTTFVAEDAPADAVEAALAQILDAHPWEVPVIESYWTELLERAPGA